MHENLKEKLAMLMQKYGKSVVQEYGEDSNKAEMQAWMLKAIKR